MTVEAKAIQLSNTQVQVTWTATVDTMLQWAIRRTIDAQPVEIIALVRDFSARAFFDTDPAPAGAVVTYSVTDDTTAEAGSDTITMADLEAPFTYGPVDPLVDVIRYTTLDDVKDRMGITNTESDAQLTQAIIAAEVAIDQVNQRSLPDIGTNPEIPGVPQAIRTWALDASIAIWKAADAPFGQGGGDAWLGSLDTQNITERILRRHPLALGYKVFWGIS